MNKEVKIASIIWYQFLPAHFGGQKVIESFNNLLSADFNFIAIASINNSATHLSYNLYSILPNNKWQIINPIVWVNILRLLKKHQITHLVLEHPYHVITAQLCKWFLKIKIIHHVHNLEHIRFKKLGKFNWRFIQLLENWMFKISHLNIFLTKEDLFFSTSHHFTQENKCFLLPYFIERKDISKKLEIQHKIKTQFQILDSTKIIFFNGTLDYKPNAEALENIFDEILPSLNNSNTDFKILVSGRILNDESQYLKKYFNSQIIYVGHVENVEEYFLASDVYINPVIHGEGVQTKTLEALSYNLPVVCFSNMLNGINTELCSNKLFIANDWNTFNDKILESLHLNENTTNSFFEYYNSATYSSALKKRIESL